LKWLPLLSGRTDVRLAGHDQVADFRREKSRKPGKAPDLRDLLGHPRFQGCIPFGKLCRLFLHLPVLVLELGIKAFEDSILLSRVTLLVLMALVVSGLRSPGVPIIGTISYQ
jgi:hypothetical protein